MELIEDTLLVIFSYLNEKDLANCEAVCKRWQMVIRMGNCWKRIFRRQITSSSSWRTLWRRMGLDESNVQAVHYTNICKAMFQYFQDVERNWLSGKFSVQEWTFPVLHRPGNFTLGEDFISYTYKTSGRISVRTLERETMAEIANISVDHHEGVIFVDQDILVCAVHNNTAINIYNSLTGEFIQALFGDDDQVGTIEQCRLFNHLLVMYYRAANGIHHLAAWKWDRPANFILLKNWSFPQRAHAMKIDDRFIFLSLISTEDSGQDLGRIVHFISPKTLKIERSLSIFAEHIDYVSGLLLIGDSEDPTRILDVASGTYLNDIPEISKSQYGVSCANHIIMAHKANLEDKPNIYDMRTIKDQKTKSFGYEISELKDPRNIRQISVDGTQLICMYSYREKAGKLIILDFAATELSECLYRSSYQTQDEDLLVAKITELGI